MLTIYNIIGYEHYLLRFAMIINDVFDFIDHKLNCTYNEYKLLLFYEFICILFKEWNVIVSICIINVT